LPSTVRGKEEVMWRDEYLEFILFCNLEDPLHVLDSLILLDTVADRAPCKALIAQDFIPWVDEDDCSVGLVYIHILFLVTIQTRFGGGQTLQCESSVTVTAYALMKASRSALTWSLSVVHMPWGAPL
jgi:hypothetical protein